MEVLREGYRIPFLRRPPLSAEPIPMPSYAPTFIKGAALEEVTHGVDCQGCCGACSSSLSRLLQPPVCGMEVFEVVAAGHRPVVEWSKKWQMPFNLDKCKIMHIGHKNKNEKYELLGKEIESVQQEKDLGVVITNDLKSSNPCIEAVKKAQKLLGYIKRQFRTRNKETILTLYNALVRPHLEYAVQF